MKKLYYHIKPAIPRVVQIAIRQRVAELKLKKNLHQWPINQAAGKTPYGWPGWPEGKKFALVLTHDVDTAVGQGNCIKLKDLEENLGFKSCFNFVPERYPVSMETIAALRECDFEIGVHGLKHDGKLYNSRRIFSKRAVRINQYIKEWGAVGFRSPSMHNNLEWLHELNIKYDSSTFDTDPFEPQSDGVETIFPFWVGAGRERKILEIPYTMPQDFTLFVLMRKRTIDIWVRKLEWVCQKGGMVVLNVHPDYMNFGGSQLGKEQYPARLYIDFLKYVKEHYKGLYWPALPEELHDYCADQFCPSYTGPVDKYVGITIQGSRLLDIC